MKRRAESSEESETKRRKVPFSTFQKWKTDMDKTFNAVSWLDCETTICAGKRFVNKLSCTVCKKFKTKICGTRNFSYKWIDGAESIRTSNIKDHAQSQQHDNAMALLKREQAKEKNFDVTTYAPIAQSLNVLSDDERDKLRKKFDIAYFVGIENLPMTKYAKLCQLEMKHGVSLGSAYLNENSCKEFLKYVALSKRQQLCAIVSKINFFFCFAG